MLHSLNIEADSGDRGDHFVKLQLVENGGLAHRIQSYHQDSHVLLADHALPYLREDQAHGSEASPKSGRLLGEIIG